MQISFFAPERNDVANFIYTYIYIIVRYIPFVCVSKESLIDFSKERISKRVRKHLEAEIEQLLNVVVQLQDQLSNF